MTFLALLTKELRLRLRRERTIWVIIIYLLLMGLLGWFYISRFSGYSNNYSGYGLGQVGKQLYYLLSMVQLFLILFITPAFTATTVNGEKERQTFDLLLCSRLSAFSLISGKLVAGLVNALLLIAASIPLFSLVFFFGGVSPNQVLLALLVFVVTTIMVGTFGLLCSALLARPAVSTAVSYMSGIIWMVMPLIIAFILLASGGYRGRDQGLFYIWNPIVALVSTYPDGIGASYTVGSQHVPIWLTYSLISVVATVLFFFLSVRFVKPNPSGRFPGQEKKRTRQVPAPKTTATA